MFRHRGVGGTETWSDVEQINSSLLKDGSLDGSLGLNPEIDLRGSANDP